MKVNFSIRWLQEALRWQWLDFQFQKDLLTREIDVREVSVKMKGE